MTNHEKAVREAATTLHASIEAARAAGYAVTWPMRSNDLPRIAISDTAKSLAAAEAKPKAPEKARPEPRADKA